MNYLKQVIYDLRHQKMMTWVTVSGTAVSVFLVMVYYMVNNVSTVEVAPELDRLNIYGGMYMHIASTDPDNHSNSSGFISYPTAKELYENLKGVEKVSYVADASWYVSGDLKVKGKPGLQSTKKKVDGNYWQIYDFKFIEGKPFTEDDCLGTTKKMVLSRRTANKLFGTTDVVGREVTNNGDKYIVCGVVENVNPILVNTFADAYLMLDSKVRESSEDEAKKPLGMVMALLKLSEDADTAAIRREVRSRYATLNSRLEKFGVKAVYHGAPFDAETMAMKSGFGSNNTPNIAKQKRNRYLVYLILILLPAINLSGMVRGRLNRRISEIGVRRAYGARRGDIIRQLLGENLLVTIAGGLIGLALSFLFMKFLSSEFFSFIDFWSDFSMEDKMATPDLGMLFTWNVFFISVGCCLLLNIMTATIPAWRAASVEPAEAISKSRT